MTKKVCFFVKLNDPSHINRVGFYQQDIKILKQLGYDVHVATSFKEICLKCDFFYVWWWTWAFFPLILAKVFGKKIIITGVFDHYLDSRPIDFPKRNIIHKTMIKLSVRYCSANIFISHYENEMIRKHFKVAKSFVSPLSIDLDKYKPDVNIRRNPKMIFTISWLSTENVKRKLILEILQAAALVREQYPDVKFLIAGKEGTGLDILKKEISKLSLEKNVFLLGAVSESDKIRYFQTCAIYLQPTMVEGFGLAILEAMACGAKVISSKRGTVPEVMGDISDLLDVNSPNEIANFILNQLRVSENELEKNTSDLIRKRAECFNITDRISQFEWILKQVLN